MSGVRVPAGGEPNDGQGAFRLGEGLARRGLRRDVAGAAWAGALAAFDARVFPASQVWPVWMWREILADRRTVCVVYGREPSGLQVRGDTVAVGCLALGGAVETGKEPGGGAVETDAEIVSLAVAPAWRRRGLGGMLLDDLLGLVRPGAKVGLVVREGNGAASGLYSSRGFEACGRIRRYYGGSDGVCMIRE